MSSSCLADRVRVILISERTHLSFSKRLSGSVELVTELTLKDDPVSEDS